MIYARIRLEEEIRIVLDIRSEVITDHGISAEERRNILRASLDQLRDLTRAVKLLERAMSPDVNGHSTLSANTTTKLRQLGIVV